MQRVRSVAALAAHMNKVRRAARGEGAAAFFL